MLKHLLTALLLAAASCQLSAAETDRIRFGDAQSEREHSFSGESSKVITGLGGYSARILLPRNPVHWEGGSMKFKLRVDPKRDNYLTARFSGDDVNENSLIAYIDGKQLGYRHLGDYDIIDHGTDEPFKPGRFYTVTTVLPRSLTEGKKKIGIELRATGRIWGYGRDFRQYQKDMTAPSRGVYEMATHTDRFFAPSEAPELPPLPEGKKAAPEKIDFSEVRRRVNKDVVKFLRPDELNNQMRMQMLAHAYFVDWTPAYQNKNVPKRLLEAFDRYFLRFRRDPSLAVRDRSTYNPEWFGFGPMADALRLHKDAILPQLNKKIKDENGKSITRRDAYAEMFKAALDYLVTHRRKYSNQSMIVDRNIRLNNEGLRLTAPEKALPEELTRRFLYEAAGLLPWSGSLDKNGKSTWPEGRSYYQLTPKHLTRELGYVGGYGEVLDLMAELYNSTRPAHGEPGDPKLRQMLDDALSARAVFRYPARNEKQEQVMRMETPIGWRDVHFPGEVTYAQRMSRDASCMQVPAITRSPDAVGYVKQMFEEQQLMAQLRRQMKEGGFRPTFGILNVPAEYELLRKLPDSGRRMPMSRTEPDFLFADETNGVLALKDGDVILYISLYWRARNAVNFLAKVHYITENDEQIATVRTDADFTPNGNFHIRKNQHNFGFGNGGPRYPGKYESAHAGEKLPVAKIPKDVRYRNGDENSHAGKAELYRLSYGNYFIAMNCSPEKEFRVKLPEKEKYREFPNGREFTGGRTVTLKPMSTKVFRIQK